MIPANLKEEIPSFSFFENLPKLLRPKNVAEALGLSTATVYDWKYRQRERNIPATLFIKINRLLYVRTDVLSKWISSQNP